MLDWLKKKFQDELMLELESAYHLEWKEHPSPMISLTYDNKRYSFG